MSGPVQALAASELASVTPVQLEALSVEPSVTGGPAMARPGGAWALEPFPVVSRF